MNLPRAKPQPSSAPEASADPLKQALDTTLAEFDLSIALLDAQQALVRLGALEFASTLGLRSARRILARERARLLTSIVEHVHPLADEPPRVGEDDASSVANRSATEPRSR